MDEVLGTLSRAALFDRDMSDAGERLAALVEQGRFLVIGGAGSIGQAVTREIFRRKPSALHVVDISENNLVELVRDLRSTMGYIPGDFRTHAIDCGSREFEALMHASQGYDYVLNLSALKHVRSEKDPFTLMRMVQVNILNTLRTALQAEQAGARKYFCVSTDKAANPVNMMGASKRIMEILLMGAGRRVPVSTARFANVAFSDGSLLHGFSQRFMKRQPISAPKDIRRYFLTPQESGELCLASCLLGDDRDIFFPKLDDRLHLTRFSDIAERFLAQRGYTVHECASEDEARGRAAELIAEKKWPCYFFASDTTGEKPFEEFFMEDEDLDLTRFQGIGVIRYPRQVATHAAATFQARIQAMLARGTWTKTELVELFNEMLPEFDHLETGKYLDDRM